MAFVQHILVHNVINQRRSIHHRCRGPGVISSSFPTTFVEVDCCCLVSEYCCTQACRYGVLVTVSFVPGTESAASPATPLSTWCNRISSTPLLLLLLRTLRKPPLVPPTQSSCGATNIRGTSRGCGTSRGMSSRHAVFSTPLLSVPLCPLRPCAPRVAAYLNLDPPASVPSVPRVKSSLGVLLLIV